MSKTYVVTGGAGFIGTNLSEKLLEAGHTVMVVDDESAGQDASRLPKSVTYYKEDIRNTEALTKIFSGADVVVHLAALPRVQFSIEHPQETHDVNVNGTLSVLVAAKKVGVKRVVYAASSSAYGDQETLPLSESLPAEPKSPYALQKFIGEGLMKLWSQIYGIETVSLRFFNVYGPHMDPDGAYALVVGKFLKMRQEGMPLTITGDGSHTRDFTHVHDTVRAIMLASESDSVGSGEVFNVGAGRNVSIKELAELVGGTIEYIEERLEPAHTRADTTYIQKMLGWKPEISIEVGIGNLKKEFKIE